MLTTTRHIHKLHIYFPYLFRVIQLCKLINTPSSSTFRCLQVSSPAVSLRVVDMSQLSVVLIKFVSAGS